MQNLKFPYIALAVGVFLMLVLTQGSQTGADGSTALPLLALLGISELAFFICGFGVWFGYKDIKTNGMQPLMAGVTVLLGMMAVAFGWLGIKLWPL